MSLICSCVSPHHSSHPQKPKRKGLGEFCEQEKERKGGMFSCKDVMWRVTVRAARPRLLGPSLRDPLPLPGNLNLPLNWSKETIYLIPGRLVEIGNTCGSLSLFHFLIRMLIFLSIFLTCCQILFGLLSKRKDCAHNNEDCNLAHCGAPLHL